MCGRRAQTPDPPVLRGCADDTSTSSDRRMAGSDAEAEASDVEASGEPLRPPPLPPTGTPLSERARPAAAAPGIAVGKGAESDTRQLPEPSHVGSSSRAAAPRLLVEQCHVDRQ